MKIISVTACTSGLAHTYLAKEKLVSAAKELGVDISVETQGAAGIKDQLSKVDLEEAKVVLLATDVEIVNKDRFIGKTIYTIPINKVVRMPKEILLSIIEKHSDEK